MKVNHRSDFTLRLTLCDLQGERLNLHAANLTLNFFTATPAVAYTASLRAGVCSNCRIEPDGTLLVVFNDHRLPLGALQCRMTLLIEDDTFPDGTRRQVLSVPTNCIISTENSDVDLSATLLVHAPLLKGERGEGGEGTGGGTLTEEAIQGITADITATLLNNPTLKGADGKDGKDGRDGTDGRDGDKGDKGEPFTFADFTPEQLASLKGADGRDGRDGRDGQDGGKGDKGDPLTFDDLTPEQREQLRGEKGADGRDGKDGADGKDAQVTQAQLDSIAQAVKAELQATLPTGGSATITPEAEQAIVNKAAKQAFIKQWNTACDIYGRYNPETDLYELNGVTNLSEQEAREILNMGYFDQTSQGTNMKTNYCRTLLPVIAGYTCNLQGVFAFCMAAEALRVQTYYTRVAPGRDNCDTYLQAVSNTREFARLSSKTLRRVYPKLKLPTQESSVTAQNVHFYNTTFNVIEELWLHSASLNFYSDVLRNNTALKFECWKYLVDNAVGTKAISIKVHPDVYARMYNDEWSNYPANTTAEQWKELGQAAIAKQIQFTT